MQRIKRCFTATLSVIALSVGSHGVARPGEPPKQVSQEEWNQLIDGLIGAIGSGSVGVGGGSNGGGSGSKGGSAPAGGGQAGGEAGGQGAGSDEGSGDGISGDW